MTAEQETGHEELTWRQLESWLVKLMKQLHLLHQPLALPTLWQCSKELFLVLKQNDPSLRKNWCTGHIFLVSTKVHNKEVYRYLSRQKILRFQTRVFLDKRNDTYLLSTRYLLFLGLVFHSANISSALRAIKTFPAFFHCLQYSLEDLTSINIYFFMVVILSIDAMPCILKRQ